MVYPGPSRVSSYRTPGNIHGLVTSNEISHSFHPEPAQSHGHSIPSSVELCKPMELVLENPFIRHDTYLTSTGSTYNKKYIENLNYGKFSIRQSKAPPLANIHYIKPDFFRKVSKGDFNPNPIYDLSESHAAFIPKRPENNIYGSPAFFISQRNVFVPLEKEDVFSFDITEPFSLIKETHPYLTTNQANHRHFHDHEIQKLNSKSTIFNMDKIGNLKNDFQVVKMSESLRDPYEQEMKLDSIDIWKNAPYSNTPSNMQKRFFRKPIYKGCLPRNFQEIQPYGLNTTMNTQFSRPFSTHLKNNCTSAVKACYFQPKHSSSSAMKIPHMYSKESQIYGSGSHVSTYVTLKDPPNLP